MIVRAIRTPIFSESDDIVGFIAKHVRKVKEESIIVVTSKIVALSEGRVVVVRSAAERRRLIESESTWQAKSKSPWRLTIRDGAVVVNAGIDDSNARGKSILLPEDCFKTAARIRRALLKKYSLTKLGILITDSRIAPLRAGVTGVALGYAGFNGVRDYRGKGDIFGRVLTVTQTNVADCLASAAVLLMGEGSEQRPLGVIEYAPVSWTNRTDRSELHISPLDDVFKNLFT
jgi:dihydrofolate synthase / folylpolyglutamate synthase